MPILYYWRRGDDFHCHRNLMQHTDYRSVCLKLNKKTTDFYHILAKTGYCFGICYD